MRLKNKGNYKLESLMTVVLSLENDFNYFEITDTMQLRHTAASEIINSIDQTQPNRKLTPSLLSGFTLGYSGFTPGLLE